MNHLKTSRVKIKYEDANGVDLEIQPFSYLSMCKANETHKLFISPLKKLKEVHLEEPVLIVNTMDRGYETWIYKNDVITYQLSPLDVVVLTYGNLKDVETKIIKKRIL